MKELCKAMSEAFPEIRKAVFDKENPHFKSKYATLGSVIDAIKPALAPRGLWFVQTIHNTPGCASVETIIMHTSGESLSCGVTAVPIVGKLDAQAYGSALSYAKRYSLSSAFGVVAEEDDDGNAASSPEKKPSSKSMVSEEVDFKAPLGDREIEILAKKVAQDLIEECGPLCAIEVKDMIAYLKHWQSISPIHPKLDGLLRDNKPAILKSFTDFINKHSPRAA